MYKYYNYRSQAKTMERYPKNTNIFDVTFDWTAGMIQDGFAYTSGCTSGSEIQYM
jgi:hypothetical protein